MTNCAFSVDSSLTADINRYCVLQVLLWFHSVENVSTFIGQMIRFNDAWQTPLLSVLSCRRHQIGTASSAVGRCPPPSRRQLTCCWPEALASITRRSSGLSLNKRGCSCRHYCCWIKFIYDCVWFISEKQWFGRRKCMSTKHSRRGFLTSKEGRILRTMGTDYFGFLFLTWTKKQGNRHKKALSSRNIIKLHRWLPARKAKRAPDILLTSVFWAHYCSILQKEDKKCSNKCQCPDLQNVFWDLPLHPQKCSLWHLYS